MSADAPPDRVALVADVGGSSIKLGRVERMAGEARLAERVVVPLVDPLRLEATLPALAEAASALRTPAVDGLCLCLPKMVDPRTGRVAGRNRKLDDAETLDLHAWAGRTLGLPLVVENDARAALVGEWRAGAGRGCDDLLMVTLGTGFGSAAVVGGRVLRGSHGHAGVLGGHLSLRLGGVACACGNAGCVEAEASTATLPALIRRLADDDDPAPGCHARSGVGEADPAGSSHPLEGVAPGRSGGSPPPPSLLRPPGDTRPAPTFREVFAAAAAGEPLAAAARSEAYRVWSAGILNLVLAYGSTRVLLGGGVAGGADGLAEAADRWIRERGWITWGPVDVRPATLGNDAALLGGLFLLDEFSPPDHDPTRAPARP